MGSIKIKHLLLFLIFTNLTSCKLLDNGFFDENNQYVPKNPKYELKNNFNKGSITIDTASVYKLIKAYEDDALIYPIFINKKSFLKTFNESNYYIKFYGNGRCLRFSKLRSDININGSELNNTDLDPDQNFYIKNYYSYEGYNLLIENFYRGDGKGYYNITEYKISKDGDTIKSNDKVYIKQDIPQDWNKYKVNW